MSRFAVWAGLLVLINTQVTNAAIYDNNVGSDEINAGGVSDDARDAQPQFADDFELENDSTISLIRWWGYYDNDALPADDFRIEFFEDNGGLPQDVPFLTIANPTTRADSGDTFVGFPNITIYEFTMAVNDELFHSGTRYWLSAVNDTAPDTVYVAGGNSSSPGLTASRLNNPPPGPNTSDWNSSGIELAFQLEGTIVVLPVDIDVKPGNDENCLNMNGHGVIPVAVLGSETFDVTTIDTATLTFGGLEVRVKGNGQPQCSLEDVNGDGFTDLVCHFEDDLALWAPGDGEATLLGELLDGTPIEGTDSICIVP